MFPAFHPLIAKSGRTPAAGSRHPPRAVPRHRARYRRCRRAACLRFLREIRNSYVPQLIAGSGLGWTYGYPLTIGGSPPALVNVVAQSTFFNPSQSQSLKAAKIEWHAAEIQDKDQRNAVIQDVALTYTELAKWEARLARLQDDEAEAQKMEHAVSDRVQEGVDSTVDLNKAKLTTARVPPSPLGGARIGRCSSPASLNANRSARFRHRNRTGNRSSLAARALPKKTPPKRLSPESRHQNSRSTFPG